MKGCEIMKNNEKIVKSFLLILTAGILFVGLLSACSKTNSAEGDYNWREPPIYWEDIEV